MPDRLILQDLTAECRLGVYERERETPQPIWIDVELSIDAKRAAAQDDVKDAVDYAALVAAVRELAQAKPYRLLETLAETIAGLVLERWRTDRVRVRVKKRALEGLGYAAVEVERDTARPRRARPDRRLTAAKGAPE